MRTAVLGMVACGLALAFGAADQRSNAADGRDAAQRAVAAPAAEAQPTGEGAPSVRDRAADGSTHPRGGKMGRGAEPLLTQEQTEKLLQFTRDNFPDVYQRLAILRQESPVLFSRALNRVARSMIPLMRANTENPDLAQKMIAEHKAQLGVEELTLRYRKTQDAAQKQQLREQLRKKIEAKFDARLERLRAEIANLQRRLNEAQQNLASQEKEKQILIDRRLAELTSTTKPE
jgi:hypothetical protein